MWKYFRIKYCKLSYGTPDTYNEKSNTSSFITPTAALIHISHVQRALQLHPLSEPLLGDSADAVKVTKVITKRLEQSFFTVPPPALFVLGNLLSVISFIALQVRLAALRRPASYRFLIDVVCQLPSIVRVYLCVCLCVCGLSEVICVLNTNRYYLIQAAIDLVSATLSKTRLTWFGGKL